MKKKILDYFLTIVWGLIIGITVFVLINNTNTTMYQTRQGIDIIQVDKYIYAEEDCSEEDIKEVEDMLGYLPQSLLDKFIGKNGKVILVAELKGDCVGTTEIFNDEITVYIENEFVYDALLHEFGHVYLYFYPMEDDFTELYETEAKSLVTSYYGDCPYYYSDITEYFAHAFQTVLVMGGYDTLDAAPNTFSYMTELITKLFSESK